MARIDARLLTRLESKLGVSLARVYQIIADKARESHLPRHLAAIAVASENRINVQRFATADELAQIRSAVGAVPRREARSDGHPDPNPGKTRKPKERRRTRQRTGDTVFVVHGRNKAATDALYTFLRSLGLRPLEWIRAIELTEVATPYVGQILDAAFKHAHAIVVLLTPDDEVRLRTRYRSGADGAHERHLYGQARPNVLFEAGMAFGRDDTRTILVQIGRVKPFSDIAGKHIVHLDNSAPKRKELVVKLKNAGCEVDDSGTDWLSAGVFAIDGPRKKRKKRK